MKKVSFFLILGCALTVLICSNALADNKNDMPPAWFHNHQAGTWHPQGHFQSEESGNMTSGPGRNFVVTPEPVAFLLYGLGGLPLAAHFLRRRKKIAD